MSVSLYRWTEACDGQPCVGDCDLCGDLISRQDAIEALKGLPTWWADSGGFYGEAQPPMEALLDPEDAISALENLPSAHCTDCPLKGVVAKLP